jgi:hypothetical protein
MKIRYGLIYIGFVVVGAGYEFYINHFSGIAIVNYLLTGFLYASAFFIAFYVVARIVILAVNWARHKEE